MKARRSVLLASILGVFVGVNAGVGQDQSAVTLPSSVRAIWDMGKANRDTTPTREHICINGLWQWQPALQKSAQPPSENWGYFKVPGRWPGYVHYVHRETQTLYPHPSWKDRKLTDVGGAWYQRKFAVPEVWAGRRIALHRLSELVRSSLHRWQAGRRDQVSRRRVGADALLPAGSEAGPEHAGDRHATRRRHDVAARSGRAEQHEW